jgi:hypothetical protein
MLVHRKVAVNVLAEFSYNTRVNTNNQRLITTNSVGEYDVMHFENCCLHLQGRHDKMCREKLFEHMGRGGEDYTLG